jgi:tetratricopeptide (TPR) repeat protein
VIRSSLFALAGIALLLAGCTSPEERVARHLERAQLYVDQSQPEKALVDLQSALKLDPKNFEINLLTAEALVEIQRMDDALFYFEEAHRLEPQRDEPTLGIAQLLLFRETDRAESLVREVLERSPDHALAHQMLSDVWLVRGDFEAALASAEKSFELEPGNPRNSLQIAMVRKAYVAEHVRAGRKAPPELIEEAEKAFVAAAQLAEDEQHPQWLLKAVRERVELMQIGGGRGAEIAELLKKADESLQPYPLQDVKLLSLARRTARGQRNAELEEWAITRTLELTPGRYRSWNRLADLTEARGGDPYEVLARMLEQRADDAEAHTSYAEYLSRHGRVDEATAHLEGVVSDLERQDIVLAGLTTLYLKAGDFDAATRTLDRLREDYPDSSQTDFAEVMLARAEGRRSDAIEAMKRWSDRTEAPQPLSMLALELHRSGNPRDALDAVDRAIAADEGKRLDLQRLRGRILVSLGDYQAGLRALIAARQQGERLPIEFVPDLARALYALGRDEAARGTLQRALDEKRPEPSALLLFAREEAERDPAASRQALERGASLYPTRPVFVDLLITAEMRDGDTEQALARAQEAADRMPDAARIQMTLARTLLAAGRTDEAVQQVEIVRERWPGQVGVAALYLEVMARAGRSDQAFQVLAQQHEAGGLSPQGRVLLAQVHVVRGEDAKAVELLRSAIADQPGMAAAQNDLAFLLARRGESLPEATELAQEARANRPDSPQIADTLGYVYLRRDLGEAALVQFDAATELSEPQSTGWATAQYHRGLALRMLGREEEAIVAIEQALASGAEFGQSQEAHQALVELARSRKDAAGS